MSVARKKGFSGESLACQHFAMYGYQILRRNFFTRFGEIDIILFKHKELIFVEVKTYDSSHIKHPLQTLTEKKRKAMFKSALMYMSELLVDYDTVRFDLVWIKDKTIYRHYLDILSVSGEQELMD